MANLILMHVYPVCMNLKTRINNTSIGLSFFGSVIQFAFVFSLKILSSEVKSEFRGIHFFNQRSSLSD